MIDSSEKHCGWLNVEHQSPHVIERHSKENKPPFFPASQGLNFWGLVQGLEST